MTTKIKTYPEFPCTTWVHGGSRWGGRKCGRPSTVVQVRRLRDDEPQYEPTCKLHHTHGMKRGFMTFVEYREDIEAILNTEKLERAAALAKERVEREQERQKRAAAETKRRTEEDAVEWQIVRADRNGNATWRILPTVEGHFFSQTIEVIREDGRPPQIDVSTSSRMTPKQAAKIAEALALAVAEATA